MFSLSGKSKNQIPCFPCAVATLPICLLCPVLGGVNRFPCFSAGGPKFRPSCCFKINVYLFSLVLNLQYVRTLTRNLGLTWIEVGVCGSSAGGALTGGTVAGGITSGFLAVTGQAGSIFRTCVSKE